MDRLAWQVPLAAVFWLGLVYWPFPPTGHLDSSWSQVLVKAWTEQWQFGPDLIFTYGPWGFLFPGAYLPEGLALKLAFEVAGKLLFAVLLVELCTNLSAWRRVLLAGVLLAFGWVAPDAVLMFIIGVLVLRWLLRSTVTTGARVACCGLLAFLALGKFSNFVLIVGSLCLTMLVFAIRRRVDVALLHLAVFAGALTMLWVAASQSLWHLPEYVRLSRELSGAYASAMATDEPWLLFGIAVALLLFELVILGWLAAVSRPYLESWCTCLVIASGLAIAWKSGFTRADAGHVVIFFVYGLLVAIALPAFMARRLPIWTVAATLSLPITGVLLARPEVRQHAATYTLARARMSVSALTRMEEARDTFKHGLQAETALWQFPRTRARVGHSTIDLIGHEQGILYLNGLNHRSRPVPQSYAAFSPTLLAKNAAFFQTDRAPEYVLATLNAIDGRYGTQSDSVALAELPTRYESILYERGYVLLKRRALQPAPGRLRLSPLLDVSMFPGEEIALPPERSHALWLQVEPELSALGHLRGLLYKPPQLSLSTFDERREQSTARLVPGIASAGFIIQPLISDQSTFAAFLLGEAGRWTRSLRIDTVAGEGHFWRGLRVRVSRVESLPLLPMDPYKAAVLAGSTNLRPVAITGSPWELRDGDPPSIFLHAPGEIVFTPPPHLRQLTGELGIERGAYTDEGRTDGVEFVVAIRTTIGEQVVYRRTLEPLTRELDRGSQAFSVVLPDTPGLRVSIRTLPGAVEDAQWDWSYVTDLKFATLDPAPRRSSPTAPR